MRWSELNPWRRFTEWNFLGWEAGLTPPKRVVIHGGGWSGLCLGLFLQEAGFKNFVIVEPGEVGGLIRSERLSSGLREWAANGFLSGSTAMSRIEKICGLRPLASNLFANKKFVLRKQQLCALPTNFREFMTEPFLGTRSKWLLLPRLFRFLCFGRPSFQWSVEELMKRACGTEVARVLAPALVAGIYGGQANRIALGAAFPRIYGRFERRRRSTSAQKPTRSTLVSYPGGMGEAVQAMAAKLRDHLVRELPSWAISPDENVLHVCTAPAHVLSRILPGALSPVAQTASKCEYAPFVSVNVFVPRSFLPKRREGFGVLVPPQEGRRVLGILFNDVIFPERVWQTDMASLNLLFGGMGDKDVVGLSDAALLALAEKECRDLLGMTGTFLETHIVRVPKAIPQYTNALGDFWDFAHRTLLTFNWHSHHRWILFGNYTGQVALRGIAEGALKLAGELTDRERGDTYDI